MNKDYPDQKQKLAVCFSAWKRRKAKAAYVIETSGDEYIVDASQARPNRLHVPENWDRVQSMSTKDFSCWAGANDWENSWTAVAFVFGSGSLGSYTRRVWGHIEQVDQDGDKWNDHGKQVVAEWVAGAHSAREARKTKDYTPSFSPEDFTDIAPHVKGLTGWGVERVQWIAANQLVVAKEPIDSDIEKRNKTASNPPKNALPGLNPNGGVAPNPYNSTAPSSDLPDRGSDNQEKKGKHEKVDSMDQGKKPNLDDMSWMMGEEYVPILDEHTGLAKWPLSFKRIEKDTKRPNKPYHKDQDVPKDQRKPEQPSTVV